MQASVATCPDIIFVFSTPSQIFDNPGCPTWTQHVLRYHAGTRRTCTSCMAASTMASRVRGRRRGIVAPQLEEAGTRHSLHSRSRTRRDDACRKGGHLTASSHQRAVPLPAISDHVTLRQSSCAQVNHRRQLSREDEAQREVSFYWQEVTNSDIAIIYCLDDGTADTLMKALTSGKVSCHAMGLGLGRANVHLWGW
jgi:hypothetical protein